MSEDSEIKTYDEGVKDAKNEYEKRFAKKQSLDLFAEGYKIGFAEGYKAGREEFKAMMLSQMPPDIKKQMDEGAQSKGWVPWW
jgi:flagellar biosynthesis/type III secretory pathway protein FliH